MSLTRCLRSLTFHLKPSLSASAQSIASRSFSLGPVLSSERRFSEKHEWVTKDGTEGTIGISLYAQESLGDVVYVQLPDVGSDLSASEEAGAVESVKAASEIYTPVSGKVTAVNGALEAKPGLVNTACYTDGWLFKIQMTQESEFEKLMSESDYESFLKTVKH